jgi:hypothetical protein
MPSEARWALATHRVHACRHGTNYRDEAVVNLPQPTSLRIDLTYVNRGDNSSTLFSFLIYLMYFILIYVMAHDS